MAESICPSLYQTPPYEPSCPTENWKSCHITKCNEAYGPVCECLTAPYDVPEGAIPVAECPPPDWTNVCPTDAGVEDAALD
jgi:hypothetical protein